MVALEAGDKQLTGGDIAEHDAGIALVRVHRADIVVLALVEHTGFHDGTGGDDADDIALDKPLGGFGILGLLADCDLVALLDQSGDVALGGMEGYAAHRRALLLSAVAAREGELQLLGSELGVVEKHLIEIAETEEQDAVLVLLFDLKILLHHRR